MILYRFSIDWQHEGKYKVDEIEAEEREKTFLTAQRELVKKSDINELRNGYGYVMFRLDDNAAAYLQAVIESKERNIEYAKKRLEEALIEASLFRETLGELERGEV